MAPLKPCLSNPGLLCNVLHNRVVLARQEDRRGVSRNTAAAVFSALWIVVGLLGALVVAAIAAGQAGALPALPTQLVLALVLPAFYAAALVAIGRDAAGRSQVVAGPRRSPDDALLDADGSLDDEGDPSELAEVDQVYRWRHRRLLALGVSEMAAALLAVDVRFSVHDLERLLAAGCPLVTALRILRPV